MSKLLERFTRYVKVDTRANEETEDYPSSPGQFDLGRILADELKALKLEDVSMDENGIVMGTIPGNMPGAPTMAWLAHMDTSPEYSGKDVKPIYAPTRPGDVKHSLADITAARKLIGFEPVILFREGLERSIEWYRNNL